MTLEELLQENTLYKDTAGKDTILKDRQLVIDLFWINTLGFFALKKKFGNTSLLKKWFTEINKTRIKEIEDDAHDMAVSLKLAVDAGVIQVNFANDLAMLIFRMKSNPTIDIDEDKLRAMYKKIPFGSTKPRLQIAKAVEEWLDGKIDLEGLVFPFFYYAKYKGISDGFQSYSKYFYKSISRMAIDYKNQSGRDAVPDGSILTKSGATTNTLPGATPTVTAATPGAAALAQQFYATYSTKVAAPVVVKAPKVVSPWDGITKDDFSDMTPRNHRDYGNVINPACLLKFTYFIIQELGFDEGVKRIYSLISKREYKGSLENLSNTPVSQRTLSKPLFFSKNGYSPSLKLEFIDNLSIKTEDKHFVNFMTFLSTMSFSKNTLYRIKMYFEEVLDNDMPKTLSISSLVLVLNLLIKMELGFPAVMRLAFNNHSSAAICKWLIDHKSSIDQNVATLSSRFKVVDMIAYLNSITTFTDTDNQVLNSTSIFKEMFRDDRFANSVVLAFKENHMNIKVVYDLLKKLKPDHWFVTLVVKYSSKINTAASLQVVEVGDQEKELTIVSDMIALFQKEHTYYNSVTAIDTETLDIFKRYIEKNYNGNVFAFCDDKEISFKSTMSNRFANLTDSLQNWNQLTRTGSNERFIFFMDQLMTSNYKNRYLSVYFIIFLRGVVMNLEFKEENAEALANLVIRHYPLETNISVFLFRMFIKGNNDYKSHWAAPFMNKLFDHYNFKQNFMPSASNLSYFDNLIAEKKDYSQEKWLAVYIRDGLYKKSVYKDYLVKFIIKLLELKAFGVNYITFSARYNVQHLNPFSNIDSELFEYLWKDHKDAMLKSLASIDSYDRLNISSMPSDCSQDVLDTVQKYAEEKLESLPNLKLKVSFSDKFKENPILSNILKKRGISIVDEQITYSQVKELKDNNILDVPVTDNKVYLTDEDLPVILDDLSLTIYPEVLKKVAGNGKTTSAITGWNLNYAADKSKISTYINKLEEDSKMSSHEKEILIRKALDVIENGKQGRATRVLNKVFNEHGLVNALNDVKQNSLIPITKVLTDKDVVNILKFNNFSIDDVPAEYKYTPKKKVLDWLKEARKYEPVLPKLKVTETNLTEEDYEKMTLEYYTKYGSKNHGSTLAKFIKTFDVQLVTPEMEKWKAANPNPTLIPAFHGTGSVAASMVLRFGFKVVTKSIAGVTITGKMLGDGVYFAQVLNKSLQYVGDEGYNRRTGTKGYILECDVYLGKKDEDWKSAHNTISPEWCVYSPREQVWIKKAHLIEIASSSYIELLKDKYKDLTVAESYFKDMPKDFEQYLLREEESNMENIKNTSTFVFYDGKVPYKGDYIDFDEFMEIKKNNSNIKLGNSQYGPEITFYHSDPNIEGVYMIPSSMELAKENPEGLLDIWNSLIK